ncbi:hypothetical protein QML37_31680, partial [Klebsiella pneumoniae]|uniref:hypothetical protein n=1 Tax=Klebsiella pneumoniae TaxID=573 RepID=UPI003A803437
MILDEFPKVVEYQSILPSANSRLKVIFHLNAILIGSTSEPQLWSVYPWLHPPPAVQFSAQSEHQVI